MDPGGQGSRPTEGGSLPGCVILGDSGGSCKVQQARRTAASAVTEAKLWVWEEFGEAMEKDFWSVPKLFWKTVRHLRKGKRGTIQAVYSKNGTLLTSTEKVIGKNTLRNF